MKIQIKKLILTVLAVTFVFTGISYGDYYNRHNVYDNFSYADYEFRHSNAEFHINRYRGNIYYFHHYRANVYFVMAGPHVFVVPGYRFRSYMHRPNFYWVSRDDFIGLSSVNFGYYDSYVRFGYYFRFYDNNPWGVRNHIMVTRNYRNYYLSRYHSRRYYRHHKRVMAGHRHTMRRVKNLRHKRNGYKRSGYKRDGYKNHGNYRNFSYRNSNSQRRHKPVKRRNYSAARKVKHRAHSRTYGRTHSGRSSHVKSKSRRNVTVTKRTAKRH